MELVWLAFLEKMVKVGITRGSPVEIVVGVGGSLVGVDSGGTVGVDIGSSNVEVGTVGIVMDNFGRDLATVGAEVDNVIVTPALSQRPLMTLTVS